MLTAEVSFSHSTDVKLHTTYKFVVCAVLGSCILSFNRSYLVLLWVDAPLHNNSTQTNTEQKTI